MLFLNQTEVYVLLAVCAAAAVGIIAIVVLSIWIVGRLKRRKALLEQESAGDAEAEEEEPEGASMIAAEEEAGASDAGTAPAYPGMYPYPVGTGAASDAGASAMQNGAQGAYASYPAASYPTAYSPYCMYVIYPNTVLYYDANRYTMPGIYIR